MNAMMSLIIIEMRATNTLCFHYTICICNTTFNGISHFIAILLIYYNCNTKQHLIRLPKSPQPTKW